MKQFGLQKGVVVALVIGVSVISVALAESQGTEQNANNKGFSVAARSDRSDMGFGDSKVRLVMILRNPAGTESRRKMFVQTLEMANENLGDRSLIIFDSPADVSGTALLSHARILEPDDQWLFLPALKRTKRISSVNRSGPFVGSEFAFEDLTSEELNKFTYKYLRSEPCGDKVCDVVERIPRYEHSGYKQQIAWFDQAIYQVRKVEFYDRRNELIKVLTVEDYRQYLNRYWRAHRYSMVNMKTKKSTDLIYDDYDFKTGLSKRDFDKFALSRSR